MFHKITHNIPVHSRWRLTFKIIPLIVAVVAIKYAVHHMGYEFLTLNALFTAIISANIFLIGFLISGTLADYKESEKIPGDLAASMEAMADEGLIIYANNNSVEAKNYLRKLSAFNELLVNWFYKKEKIATLKNHLRSFNDDFLALEGQTQANFIVRLKQEQHAIRKMIHRVHTIRETSFLGAGYAIAEIITFILIVGLIFIKMTPFYEGMFFIAFVSFILVYMIYFIKDLDNPFGYDEEDNLVEEVSLKPVIDSRERIARYCDDLGA